MNEQRAVTTWIPICCVCHQVRDDRQSHDCPTQNGFDAWMSLRSFLRHYRVTLGDVLAAHAEALNLGGRDGIISEASILQYRFSENDVSIQQYYNPVRPRGPQA